MFQDLGTASLRAAADVALSAFEAEWDRKGSIIKNPEGFDWTELSLNEGFRWQKLLAHHLLAELADTRNLLRRPLGADALSLRPSQWRGLHGFVKFLQNVEPDEDRCWVSHPPGAGKTFFTGVLCRMLPKQRPQILVPNRYQVDQWKKELVEKVGVAPERLATMGEALAAARENSWEDRRIFVQTYGAHLYHAKNDPVYASWAECRNLIFCDEAQLALGMTHQSSLPDTRPEKIISETLERFKNPIRHENGSTMVDFGRDIRHAHFIVGLTGTPSLAAKHIRDYFGRCITQESYASLTEAGIIVPLNVVEIPICLEDGAKWTDQDIQESLFEDLILSFRSVQEARTIDPEQLPLRGIALFLKRDQCRHFAEIAADNDLRVKTILSPQAEAKLAEAGDKLNSGELDLLVSTVQQAGNGLNIPRLNALLLGFRTMSPARMIQAFGRANRSLVIDGVNKENAQIFLPYFINESAGGWAAKEPLSIEEAFIRNGELQDNLMKLIVAP